MGGVFSCTSFQRYSFKICKNWNFHLPNCKFIVDY
ncbi:uncharacterized protein CELE_R06B10.7 [Caenorhabditis elegans]|uniref:Uncharacterized protein n=1 Tax=Caenorhabditis elegans TaxID=6239 RepID=Q8IA65_CAEEL|nr:Uncharacterized protein CELE_R06B10.7 [Caenorhabditis elegans]CCD73249.1 Uncharacterized protein CELE_R06B10.7 [Caenorhabditis elegans]|eukprot:NP_871703.1 Uncharacterized protein CELE_R06B10.7 [Caenorhabditis elegans]